MRQNSPDRKVVCVRERESERERESGRERARESEKERERERERESERERRRVRRIGSETRGLKIEDVTKQKIKIIMMVLHQEFRQSLNVYFVFKMLFPPQ